MNVVRARAVLKEVRPNASYEEKERAFKGLLANFKRKVDESGVLVEYKQKQYYESPGEKKKRKAKQAEIEREKEKKANFRKLNENM